MPFRHHCCPALKFNRCVQIHEEALQLNTLYLRLRLLFLPAIGTTSHKLEHACPDRVTFAPMHNLLQWHHVSLEAFLHTTPTPLCVPCYTSPSSIHENAQQLSYPMSMCLWIQEMVPIHWIASCASSAKAHPNPTDAPPTQWRVLPERSAAPSAQLRPMLPVRPPRRIQLSTPAAHQSPTPVWFFPCGLV